MPKKKTAIIGIFNGLIRLFVFLILLVGSDHYWRLHGTSLHTRFVISVTGATLGLVAMEVAPWLLYHWRLRRLTAYYTKVLQGEVGNQPRTHSEWVALENRRIEAQSKKNYEAFLANEPPRDKP